MSGRHLEHTDVRLQAPEPAGETSRRRGPWPTPVSADSASCGARGGRAGISWTHARAHDARAAVRPLERDGSVPGPDPAGDGRVRGGVAAGAPRRRSRATILDRKLERGRRFDSRGTSWRTRHRERSGRRAVHAADVDQPHPRRTEGRPGVSAARVRRSGQTGCACRPACRPTSRPASASRPRSIASVGSPRTMSGAPRWE